MESTACTCNRRQRLRASLESFERLEVPATMSWEMIVVDNNSSDGTDAVIAAFAEKRPLPPMRLVETERGKSRALNTAIHRTRCEIVVFTDDDWCTVDPSWLRAVVAGVPSRFVARWLGGRVELTACSSGVLVLMMAPHFGRTAANKPVIPARMAKASMIPPNSRPWDR